MATSQVVYIHGVVAERTRTGSHDEQWQSLLKGLASEGISLPTLEKSVTVEWGWNTADAGTTRTLEGAQREIAERVEAATPKDRTGFTSLLFAPAIKPVRELLTLGWSDLLYYVGRGGKKRVRQLVWNEIISRVGADQEVDLTIISHSGGTLIAHDFLYWIFSGDRDSAIEAIDGVEARETFQAARRNWRIRRLVTFGSPIAALLVRSAEMADLLDQTEGAKLSVASIGLDRPSHAGPEPIWLNVWDRHDILSFPVAPFYDSERVRDIYPDHSDSLINAHEDYWESKKVHRELAEFWDR